MSNTNEGRAIVDNLEAACVKTRHRMQVLESMLEAERQDLDDGIMWRTGGMVFELRVADMVRNDIEDGLACGEVDAVEDRHYT